MLPEECNTFNSFERGGGRMCGIWVCIAANGGYDWKIETNFSREHPEDMGSSCEPLDLTKVNGFIRSLPV